MLSGQTQNQPAQQPPGKGAAAPSGAKDAPVVSRIDAPTPREVVEELRAKVPGFRRGYDEDGLAVEEFADYGPLMFFKAMFLNGYARLLDEVAERRAR